MSHSARRRIPGTQPTVEIVVRRWVTPRSGSRSQAPSTASRLSIGSPMPMNTQWSIGPRRRKCSAWSRISDADRLRAKRIEPVAQKVHVSGHPDCEDRHTERRPSRKRISTASSGCPSRGREQGLDGAVARPAAWPSSSQARERHLARQALAQLRRQVGHLLVAAGPAGEPPPHLAGAKAWLAALRRVSGRAARGPWSAPGWRRPGSYGGSRWIAIADRGDAPSEVPGPRGRGLAARVGGDRRRRTGDGRGPDGHRPCL